MLEASKKLVEVVDEVFNEVVKNNLSITNIETIDAKDLKQMQLVIKLMKATNELIIKEAETLDKIETKMDQIKIKLDLLSLKQES